MKEALLLILPLAVLYGEAVASTAPVKISTAHVTRAAQPSPAKKETANLSQMATLQTALDRNGFGVGLSDGREGSKTTQALKDYASSRGLTISQARKELFADTEPATNLVWSSNGLAATRNN